MEDDSPLRPLTLANNVLLWRIIAVVSVLSHLFFVWLSSLGLRDDVPVIYWQKYIEYIFYFRFLTLVVFLIALWLSSERKHRGWATFAAVIGSCVILGFAQFILMFPASFVTHVGSFQLHDKTYQFASVARYDDETMYYLGECERNSLVCAFFPIYSLYRIGKQPEAPLKLIDNSRELVVEIGNEIIYFFDGVNVNCHDSDYGYCMSDNDEE
jgi:hypothetical protein